MDGYEPKTTGSFTGMQKVTVAKIEAVTAKSGRAGFKFTFYKDDPAHPMFKQVYQNKMFDRFITSIVTDLGENPMELQKACRAGRGSEWIVTRLAGRSGMFDCEYGEPNQNGKQYIEPFCKAEVEFMEWQANKNSEQGGQQAQYQQPQANNYPPKQQHQQPPQRNIGTTSGYSDYSGDNGQMGFVEDLPF